MATELFKVMSPSDGELGQGSQMPILGDCGLGRRHTKVDPKVFGRQVAPAADLREWQHFEWVSKMWPGFLY